MSFASRYWWDNSLWECWQCIKLSRSPKLSRDDRVTGAFLRKEPHHSSGIINYTLSGGKESSHLTWHSGWQTVNIWLRAPKHTPTWMESVLESVISTQNLQDLGLIRSHPNDLHGINCMEFNFSASERWRVSWSCQGFKFMASWPQNVKCIASNKPAQWLGNATWFSELLPKKKKRGGGNTSIKRR